MQNYFIPVKLKVAVKGAEVGAGQVRDTKSCTFW